MLLHFLLSSQLVSMLPQPIRLLSFRDPGNHLKCVLKRLTWLSIPPLILKAPCPFASFSILPALPLLHQHPVHRHGSISNECFQALLRVDVEAQASCQCFQLTATSRMSDSCLAVETPLVLVSLLGSMFSILFSLRPSGPWGVSKLMSSNPSPSFSLCFVSFQLSVMLAFVNALLPLLITQPAKSDYFSRTSPNCGCYRDRGLSLCEAQHEACHPSSWSSASGQGSVLNARDSLPQCFPLRIRSTTFRACCTQRDSRKCFAIIFFLLQRNNVDVFSHFCIFRFVPTEALKENYYLLCMEKAGPNSKVSKWLS